MNELERVEKERKLREQAEATIAFINMIFNELTEAKELIKRVVEWADADHPKEYFEWIVKDLKQFLKED